MSPSPDPEFLVYAQRSDRLTSRMEAMISSWRIARGLKRKLVFFWPKPYGYEEGDYSAATIFDLRAMIRSKDSRDMRIAERRTIGRKDALNLKTSPGWPYSLDRQALRKQQSHIFFQAEHTMEFQDEDPEEVQKERKKLFRLIRPHPLILENLEKAAAWLGSEPFTAVHIRRGDIVDKLAELMVRYGELQPASPADSPDLVRAEERLAAGMANFTQRGAPLEAYAAAARRSDPRRRILVFSDLEAAAAEFQQQLPGRAIVPFSSFKTDLTELQRSWLDVLILMRARQIISTRSAFGRFASYYADVPFVDVCPPSDGRSLRKFFLQQFDPILGNNPPLRKKCLAMLDASIRFEFLAALWMVYRRLAKRARFILTPKKKLE